MRISLIAFVFWTGIVSCDRIKPENVGVVTYFNLDSLIDQQVASLSNQGVFLEKTVSIDSARETKKVQLDSSEWEEELGFLRQLNINQPRLIGAYNKEVLENRLIRYSPKNSNLPIKYLETVIENDTIRQLNGHLLEKNDVYTTSMRASLLFEKNQLREYQIKGFQKIILKDTALFNIRGNIFK
jgi:hypothetical protein